ncbi:hypothetical protein HDV04_005222, partial [Boothiomyces sp. JEL0838]
MKALTSKKVRYILLSLFLFFLLLWSTNGVGWKHKSHPKNATEISIPKRAYMFYVTNKNYGCCVMVFAQRFKLFKSDPTIDVVAFVTGLDEQLMGNMRDLGIKVIEVEALKSNHAENEISDYYLESITKFQIFKNWGYDKFVYLDADSILMGNIDHLFDLPEIPTFWTPRAYWLGEELQPAFTSILIVGKPSEDIFNASVALSKTDNSLFDMDVLNKLYRHQVGLLPNIYGLTNWAFWNVGDEPAEYRNHLDELHKNLKLVHFTGVQDGGYGKPWNTDRRKPEDYHQR